MVENLIKLYNMLNIIYENSLLSLLKQKLNKTFNYKRHPNNSYSYKIIFC
jgi:hypothetical protein